MAKHKIFILRRYYPYIDDVEDEEIVYMTKDAKDAVMSAAALQKKDMLNMPAVFDYNHPNYEGDENYSSSVIYITEENIDDEKAYIETDVSDAMYLCTYIVEFDHRASTGTFFYRYSMIYDYAFPNDPMMNNKMSCPQGYDDESKRAITFAYYPFKFHVYILSHDFDYFKTYEEQLIGFLEETRDALNARENPEEIKRYIYDMLDNTGRDYDNMTINGLKWSYN